MPKVKSKAIKERIIKSSTIVNPKLEERRGDIRNRFFEQSFIIIHHSF